MAKDTKIILTVFAVGLVMIIGAIGVGVYHFFVPITFGLRQTNLSEIVDIKLPLPEGFSVVRVSKYSASESEAVIADKKSDMSLELGIRDTPAKDDEDDLDYLADKVKDEKGMNFRKLGEFKAQLMGKSVNVIDALKNTAYGSDTPTYRVTVLLPSQRTFYLEAYSETNKPVDKKRFQIFLDTIKSIP